VKGDKGDAGGLNATTVVTGTSVQFGASPAVGVTASATATCASGKAVGGGATITHATGGSAKQWAALTESKMVSTNQWTATATIMVSANGGTPPSIQAYVICAS